MTFWCLSALCAAILACTSASAQAASFKGEFWDVAPFVSDANQGDFPRGFEFDSVLATLDTPPDVIFDVLVLDYPNATTPRTADRIITGSRNGDVYTETATLGEFLGADASGLTATEQAISLAGAVFRFSGFISVAAGDTVFDVTSDDGFRLSLGGVPLPDSFTGPRGFSNTPMIYTAPTAGTVAFELIYYDSGVTGAGLFVQHDDAQLVPVSGPPAIPLPASVWILMSGLVLLAGIRRAR